MYKTWNHAYKRGSISMENKLRYENTNLTDHGAWHFFIFYFIIHLIKMYEYYIYAIFKE